MLQSEATIRVNFPNSTSKTYESQSDRPHRELPLAKSPSTWRKQLSAGTRPTPSTIWRQRNAETGYNTHGVSPVPGTEEIWTCQCLPNPLRAGRDDQRHHPRQVTEDPPVPGHATISTRRFRSTSSARTWGPDGEQLKNSRS